MSDAGPRRGVPVAGVGRGGSGGVSARGDPTAEPGRGVSEGVPVRGVSSEVPASGVPGAVLPGLRGGVGAFSAVGVKRVCEGVGSAVRLVASVGGWGAADFGVAAVRRRSVVPVGGACRTKPPPGTTPVRRSVCATSSAFPSALTVIRRTGSRMISSAQVIARFPDSSRAPSGPSITARTGPRNNTSSPPDVGATTPNEGDCADPPEKIAAANRCAIATPGSPAPAAASTAPNIRSVEGVSPLKNSTTLPNRATSPSPRANPTLDGIRPIRASSPRRPNIPAKNRTFHRSRCDLAPTPFDAVHPTSPSPHSLPVRASSQTSRRFPNFAHVAGCAKKGERARSRKSRANSRSPR